MTPLLSRYSISAISSSVTSIFIFEVIEEIELTPEAEKEFSNIIPFTILFSLIMAFSINKKISLIFLLVIPVLSFVLLSS